MGGSHRILIVGGGGREHALAWRLARDPDVARVMVAPGNDGIASAFPCFPVRESDAPALLDLARREAVTLVVVGPEAPLASGLADALDAGGIPTYGPSAAAARLEASKWVAKQIMEDAGVPTARARACDTLADARAALDGFGPPWVLKADGLAAGKGVLVSEARIEVDAFLRACFEQGRFGDAGRRVVIEEHLAGEEASLMAVCDGERHLLLPPARDYKRARDGDRGPNTGGMGAYAPHAALDASAEATVARTVVAPVLATMARRGTPYRGTLYAGLMLTDQGPKVIEFNCRFGDPETQAVLPLVGGSLARLLASAAQGRLDAGAVRREPGAAVSVALVDEGYPETQRGGGVIEGLDALDAGEECVVFHAGTVRVDDRWVVRGGRGAHVMARGATVAGARQRAYDAIARLGGQGWRCRRD
ncbi:MAG TPA: phosphoribosylamine--glycine ligase, partial [Candidatus Eisenbacteria bacterium]|nr:phosphoribosylamine--glycine ligase [Candidatus Eisenbacteria bacterium]